MIAGDVDDARALARLAQKLLHHVVVRLRPVPARFQRPAVDDVADQIDRVGIVVAQEVEQLAGLTAARAEMDVGDEERAEVPRPGGVISTWMPFAMRRRPPVSHRHCRLMTTSLARMLHMRHQHVIACRQIASNEPRGRCPDVFRGDLPSHCTWPASRSPSGDAGPARRSWKHRADSPAGQHRCCRSAGLRITSRIRCARRSGSTIRATN